MGSIRALLIAVTLGTRSADSYGPPNGDVWMCLDKVTVIKAHLNIHLIYRRKFSCWLGTAFRDQLKILPPSFIPEGMTGCAASVIIATAWTSRVEDAKRCRRRTP